MIISHTHKFIFFRTQRVAGSSVEAALSHLLLGDDVFTSVGEQVEGYHKNRNGSNFRIPVDRREAGWRLNQFLWSIRPIRNKIMKKRLNYSKVEYWSHIPAKYVKATVPEDVWKTYHKVSIERNPWDREVSRYFSKYSRRTQQMPSFGDYLRRASPSKNFSIYSIDGDVVVDRLMRFESLQNDLRAFLHYLGVEEQIGIPKTNSSVRKDDLKYRTLYDRETKEFVANLYRSEIEYCGYSF